MKNFWPQIQDYSADTFAAKQDRFFRRYAVVLLAICLVSNVMGMLSRGA